MRPHSLSCTSRRLQSRGAHSLATQGAPVAGRGADTAVAHVPVARLAVRHGGAAVAQRLVAPHAVLDPLVVVGHGGAVDAGHEAAHVAEGHAGAAAHGTLADCTLTEGPPFGQ